MVRFVVSPDGIVIPDVMGKLPGRGVWVSSDKDSIETAIKTNAFARGFKSKVTVPDDLTKMTEDGVARHVLSFLGMAKKSGRLIIGFDQVQSEARGKALAWRIEAKDGSEDGRSKLRTLSKAVARELERPLPKVLGCFTAAEIGPVLGRKELTHAALLRGKLSKRLNEMTLRLSGFRPLIPLNWPDIEHELRGLSPVNDPS